MSSPGRNCCLHWKMQELSMCYEKVGTAIILLTPMVKYVFVVELAGFCWLNSEYTSSDLLWWPVQTLLRPRLWVVKQCSKRLPSECIAWYFASGGYFGTYFEFCNCCLRQAYCSVRHQVIWSQNCVHQVRTNFYFAAQSIFFCLWFLKAKQIRFTLPDHAVTLLVFEMFQIFPIWSLSLCKTATSLRQLWAPWLASQRMYRVISLDFFAFWLGLKSGELLFKWDADIQEHLM